MTITPQQVKELRDRTGAGMMECKKALLESGGSLDAALEYLRRQGLKAADTKAGRIAADGIIGTYLSPDAKTGVLVEVNCETDFVAKNDDLVRFANDTARLVADKNPSLVDDLLSLVNPQGEKVSERIHLLAAKIGEKLNLRRFVRVLAESGEKLGFYLHLGSKIGVLVRLAGKNVTEAMAKDIAMHVAAAHPHYLDHAEIPPDVLQKEKEIYREQLKDQKKPPAILEKIVEGKAAKFASEVCLNEQIFIKDPAGKKTVAQMLKEADPSVKVVAFARLQVGEGIEKRKEDFALEVARMAK